MVEAPFRGRSVLGDKRMPGLRARSSSAKKNTISRIRGNQRHNLCNSNEIVVVFIGGFLNPKGVVPYSLDHLPCNVRLIPVFPSGVASIHDRVINIFHELKGGKVCYGETHSKFHGHDCFGDTYIGSYPEWNENNPVHLIGHSFGGLTALALLNYLSDGDKFHDHRTCSRWIASISTVNAPLNGCLAVYGLGANLKLTPVVRLSSIGCMIGSIAHLFEYLISPTVFKLSHWPLHRTRSGALIRLLLCWLGFTVHSSTDNSAYDMTLQSQVVWARFFNPLLSIYYLSVAGTTYDNGSMITRFAYFCRALLLRPPPGSVAGIDTSRWALEGHDGLLSYYTQVAPMLGGGDGKRNRGVHVETIPSGVREIPDGDLVPGRWYSCSFPAHHSDLGGWDGPMGMAFRFSIASAAAAAAAKPSSSFPRESSRSKTKKFNDPRDDTPGPDVDHNCASLHSSSSERPDMQRPLWTVLDRPKMAFESCWCIMNLALSITALCLASAPLQHSLASADSSLVTAGSLQLLLLAALSATVIVLVCRGKDGSEVLETAASAARLTSVCAVLILSGTGTPSLKISCSLYRLMLSAEAFLCSSASELHEYHSPTVIAMTVFLLSLHTATHSIPDHTVLWVLINYDNMRLAAKAGWGLCYLQLWYSVCSSVSVNIAWTLTWAASIVSSTSIAASLWSCRVRDKSPVVSSWMIDVHILTTYVCFIFLIWEKMADLSDAFQVFMIKDFYSDSNVKGRMERA